MFRALSVGLVAIIGLGAMVIAFFAMAPTVINHNEDLRTDAAQDAGIACSTGAGVTSCALTLAAAHEYPDTSWMTVTETSPGSVDHTGNSTLDTDTRQVVTVTGLAELTSYQFTVDYQEQAANISDEMGDLLKQTPVLLAMALLVSLVLGVAAYAAFVK